MYEMTDELRDAAKEWISGSLVGGLKLIDETSDQTIIFLVDSKYHGGWPGFVADWRAGQKS